MIHHPISRSDYLALPGINQSALKHIARSPLHFRYAIENPEPPSAAMRLGAYYDHLLFGSDCQCVASPFENFRKKEAQDWKDDQEARGITVVTPKQVGAAKAMISSVLSDPASGPLLAKGKSQVAFTADHGIPFKGLTDWLVDGAALVLDLKVTTDASESAWERHLMSMGYDVQAGCYTAGLNLNTGDSWQYGWIVVEDEPPHAVAVWIAKPEILKRGRALFYERLALWDRCMQSGTWPGYTPEPRQIGLPAWEGKQWRDEV